jgi:hypothetical protein
MQQFLISAQITFQKASEIPESQREKVRITKIKRTKHEKPTPTHTRSHCAARQIEA